MIFRYLISAVKDVVAVNHLVTSEILEP